MSENIKVIPRYLILPDYIKEQNWLEKKHEEGWKLVDINRSCCVLLRCEPEKMQYKLEYNRLGDRHPEQTEEHYRQQGWQKVLCYAGITYYRRPEEEGQRDAVMEADTVREMLHRCLFARILPLIALFLAVIGAAVICGVYDDGILSGLGAKLYDLAFVCFVLVFIKAAVNCLRDLKGPGHSEKQGSRRRKGSLSEEA